MADSITKPRLPLSVRFAKRKGYETLQIRITTDGDEGSAFSTLPDGSTISTAGATWDQQQQRFTGRSDRELNKRIAGVTQGISDVYDAQIERGVIPTPKSVKGEWQRGKVEAAAVTQVHICSPLRCYRQYYDLLIVGAFPEKNLQASTLAKWQYGLTYLTQYVEETRESDPLSTGSAADLTVFWGKSYHRWLMKNGPMAAEAATRYVKRLVEAIDYQAEAGTIKQNPLATIKLSRAKTKDVYFLEPHHLERFWKLDLEERAGVACWWMGVIFLTGLDFPDAVEYVTNRHKYDQPTQWGNKIVIHRSKPPRAQCHIPILPELENLLRNQPAGPTPSDFEVNRVMYAVQVLIGFPHRLTCKVGRKTAGAIFYDIYGDIGAVSRMMGHSSIAITERYYLKTTGHTVNKIMQKQYVLSQSTPAQPFLRAA